MPKDLILHPEEIGRLARLFTALGIRKIRLTGGEPLVRNGLDDILNELQPLRDRVVLALTTNGVYLKRWLERLAEAGVTRINVSLDTLKRDRYVEITGVDKWEAVWEGINAALHHPAIEKIKINMVVLQGVNDEEVEDFAELTRALPIDVRFIETMPVNRVTWRQEQLVSGDDIISKFGGSIEAIPPTNADVGPSRNYRYPDAAGNIGLISMLSRPACADCNRLRLTAQGLMLRCLYDNEGLDLRKAMRSHQSTAKLQDDIRRFLLQKQLIGVKSIRRNVFESYSPCLAAVGG